MLISLLRSLKPSAWRKKSVSGASCMSKWISSSWGPISEQRRSILNFRSWLLLWGLGLRRTFDDSIFIVLSWCNTCTRWEIKTSHKLFASIMRTSSDKQLYQTGNSDWVREPSGFLSVHCNFPLSQHWGGNFPRSVVERVSAFVPKVFVGRGFRDLRSL